MRKDGVSYNFQIILKIFCFFSNKSMSLFCHYGLIFSWSIKFSLADVLKMRRVSQKNVLSVICYSETSKENEVKQVTGKSVLDKSGREVQISGNSQESNLSHVCLFRKSTRTPGPVFPSQK